MKKIGVLDTTPCNQCPRAYATRSPSDHRVMATASASSSTASAVAKTKKKTVKPLSKKKLEKFQEAAENRGERIKAAARPPRAHTHTNIAARPRSLPREAPAIALGGSFPGQRDATP